MVDIHKNSMTLVLWSSLPEWIENLDEYDWKYVLNSWAARVAKLDRIPRDEMKFIDRRIGKKAHGFEWAYYSFYAKGNVINIYQRYNGRYWVVMISKQ